MKKFILFGFGLLVLVNANLKADYRCSPGYYVGTCCSHHDCWDCCKPN